MLPFLISPNWGFPIAYEEIAQTARFAYTNDGYRGHRPRIVLQQPVEGIDCIEIDQDRYGIIVSAETKFNPSMEGITDYTKNINMMIFDFLRQVGANDLLTN